MSRLEQLTELRKTIEEATVRPNDDALFAIVVRTSMDLLSLSDTDLADRFGMSRPSVNRWRNGKTAPHPVMRAPVYSDLLKRVKLAIGSAEKERAGAASGGFTGVPFRAAAKSNP